MSHSTARTLFRTVAIAEAISWLGLLIAMLFKWVIIDDPNSGAEGGVPIMGPIHGVIFLVYIFACILAGVTFGWKPKVFVLGLLSSIPPFATYVFEVMADNRGLLGRPAKELATSAT